MNRFPSKMKGAPSAGAATVRGAMAAARDLVDARVIYTGTDVPALRLLRFPAVRQRTGLSRSTIWRLERQGAFPTHRRISANAVAWVEAEVDGWIQSKIDAGDV